MTNHSTHHEPRANVWVAIRRGLRLKCPKCGEGRILAGYLRPADACNVCHEDFSELRADDGPAWATLILVGHLISPAFMLFATPNDTLRWIGFAVVLSLMLAMVFFFQPRMKGLFMSIIWHNHGGVPASTPLAAATTAD